MMGHKCLITEGVIQMNSFWPVSVSKATVPQILRLTQQRDVVEYSVRMSCMLVFEE